MTTPTLLPEIEAAIADAGQALVDAWDSAQSGPPHRFAVYTDPEGDPEVAAGWMAMACMHASALAAAREAGRREVLERTELASIDGALRDCYALARAKLARESRPGGWADIVRFCERAGIKASPLRSVEARDAAKADVPTPPPEIEAAVIAAAWSIAELDRRADVMAQPEIGALRTAITSALAAAREAGRRDVLEGAAGVEEAIADYTEAAIMARPHASGHVLTAAGDDLRAAIAADKAALDATWRAHDLERDAEADRDPNQRGSLPKGG